MTREEIIKVFNTLLILKKVDCTKDELEECCKAAIKALEQEPTTKNDLGVDAVSRQAINGYIDYILSHGMGKRKSFEFIKKFVANLSSATPQEPTKNDLAVDWENYKDVDGNSLDDLILEVLQNNFDCGNTYGYKVADKIIELLPSVTPQEPRKGHWIEHPRTKELRFHHIYECSACKTQIIGNRYNVGNYKYCPHCGIEFEVEG